jgi:two-component system, NtrC family, response regulator AtoC
VYPRLVSGDARDLTTLAGGATLDGRAPALDDRAYLLVFEGETSTMVPLDRPGDLVIGRGKTADVGLAAQAVSREHARLEVGEGEVRIVDLGSQNGTRVNGDRLTGAQPLWPGDVITICGATLVFHRGLRGHAVFHFEPFADLRDRLDRELERALRYPRDLALVCVSLNDAHVDAPRVEHTVGRVVRAIDGATWSGRHEILVLLPETDDDGANLAAARLRDALRDLAPDLGIGVALCPDHARDADALLAAARAAALAAGAAEIAQGAAAVDVIDVGGQPVIVADPAMARLYALIERIAASELPVLIRGETGTGKELAASAVHHRSRRAAGPLVTLNCAALAEGLAESELFGHERGAFSGAVAAKPGLLEAAAGGTVFLDEIGELTSAVQAKLLRALDTKRVTRVGDVRERQIDVRLVAATNRDLRAEVDAGRFRRDLYYRLCGAEIELPPLRARPRDLPRLAGAFLDRACAALGVPIKRLAVDALDALAGHDWPGNVRELRHLMDYVAAATADEVVRAEHLRPRIGDAAVGVVGRDPPPGRFRPLSDELRALELRRIREALAVAGGNQTQAARLIGMPLRTFVYKLKKLGLTS